MSLNNKKEHVLSEASTKEYLSIAATTTTNPMPTFRVRITNESTGRWKELSVDASKYNTMFDSIYDHHELKTNHVRKWNSDLTRGIKSGDLEIVAEVVDDQFPKPKDSYSIDKMKNTSTMELWFSNVSGAVVNLLLRCQKKGSKRPARKGSIPKGNTQQSTSESKSISSMTSPISTVGFLRSLASEHEWKNTLETPLSNEESMETPPQSLEPLKTNDTVRVRIENNKTGRSKDLIVKVDNELNLFDSIYNHEDVKSANVRKWGGEIAKAVKSKKSEIRCLVWDDSIQQPYHSFSIEDLKTTSTKQLLEIAEEPTGLIKLVLKCYDKSDAKLSFALSPLPKNPSHKRRNSIACSVDSTFADDIASVKSKSLAELDLLVQEKKDARSAYSPSVDDSHHQKDTLRVRVVNHQSKRHKDLIVDVRDDLTINDAIYNNNGVKRANVRKWSADVVRDVKKGIQVVQMHVWDPALGKACKAYTTNELSLHSTKELLEICPVTDDAVELRLVNVRKTEDGKELEQTVEEGQPSSSSIQTDSDLNSAQVNSNPPVNMPKRHMSLAHISTMSLVSTGMERTASSGKELGKNGLTDSILNVGFGKKSTSSATPSGGQKNATWDVSTNTKKRAQLFSSQVNDSLLMMKQSVQKKVSGIGGDSRNHKMSERNSYGSLPCDDIEKKKQRFLQLSNRPGETAAEISSGGKPLRRGRDSILRQFVDLDSAETEMQNIPDPLLSTGGGGRTDQTKKFWKLCQSKMIETSERTEEGYLFEEGPRLYSPQECKEDSAASPRASPTRFPANEKKHSHYVTNVKVDQSGDTKMKKRDSAKADRLKRFLSRSTSDFVPPIPSQIEALKQSTSDLPPLDSAKDDTVEFPSSETKSSLNSSHSAGSNGIKRNSAEADRLKRFLSRSTSDFVPPIPAQIEAPKQSSSDFPPLDSTKADTVEFPSSETKSSLNSSRSAGSNGIKRNSAEADRLKRFLSRSTSDFVPPTPAQIEAPKQSSSDLPPLAEISVVTKGVTNKDMPGAAAAPPGIPLSPDVAKDVFPYHVVLDLDFRILQVGNSLHHLFRSLDESEPPFNFMGRIVSDVLMCTGPVPMYGKWDWSVLGKLKDKTLFFESVLTDSTRNKANLKGTIIQVSQSPRQIMLALLPNVKNLTELSNMDLSMGDLPLHSCQRDAVLLGEHSASEVKLTNHLDKLHRGLIDSMEQQIKDRTAELAMANESLEKANTQIQIQSARQLEHFACMSHEIRTPLNCIVGMSSILLEETHAKVDPPHAESIQMIYTSAELLRAVVDDVLDYAKLESGSFEVDITRIDLQESLASVVHSISQKIQEKNIRLRCHFSPDLPRYTETDSRRLQQVLFNLLGNAGKFSKRNSVIDLSVTLIKRNHKAGAKRDCTDEAVVDLETCDILRFSVKDYGKGIEKKDFKTIFQPFSQASKQTATVYGGTGLGLSITSKLVKRLGGRISLDSEAEKFTDFVVELPFDGVAVDEKAIQKKMKDVLIVLVTPTEIYDYSFTSYPLFGEPNAFGKQTMDYFGSRAVSVANLEALITQSNQLKDGNPGCHFALLVNEDLYDARLLNQVEEHLGSSCCTIMTFGPKYDVESTKDAHVKSIRGVLPCILLDFISQNVSRTIEKRSKVESNKSSVVEAPVQSDDTKTKPATGSNQKEQLTKSTTTKQEQTNEIGPSLKVLYAEDNKINQKVLTRVLNRVGIMDVSIVDDGLKAVNISETTAFDIIFMDMQMPVMDGIEACNLIIERDKDAKVVFVTAHALDEFKHKAKAAGGAGFISKPFRVEDIKQILRQFGFQ